MTPGQQSILAKAINKNAAEHAELAQARVNVMMLAQAGLAKRNVSGVRSVEIADYIAGHVEQCVTEFVQRKAKGATIGPAGMKSMLEALGPNMVESALLDFDSQKAALETRRKEERQGIRRGN